MSNVTLPLPQLVNLWLKDCHTRNLSIATIKRGYAYVLCDFVRWLAQDKEAAEVASVLNDRQRVITINAPDVNVDAASLTTEQIREYIEHKRQARPFEDGRHPWLMPREGTLSLSTIHKFIRVLKTFFGWCVYEEWLAANPAERIRYPKLPNRGRRIDVLTEDEISVLLDVAKRKSFTQYAVVLTILDTLLRRSELTALTLDDVNLGTGLITVRRGKGDKARWLRAGQHCQRALRRYVREHRKPKRPTDAFFLNHYGNPMTSDGVGTVFVRLSQAVQFKVHAHMLRHTGATLMAMNGENASRIADRLGHESLNMANWYIHLGGMKSAQDDASPMDKLLSSTQ